VRKARNKISQHLEFCRYGHADSLIQRERREKRKRKKKKKKRKEEGNPAS
jgi:uncharacterized protein YutD